MSIDKFEPPRLASWLLRFARPRGDDGALAGDIVERFREGKTSRWFWSQVLIALGERLLGSIRNHWPQYCYAIAGAAMPVFLLEVAKPARGILPWWTLPWPWSQLVLEQSAHATLALAALPALGAGLVINGEFRWASILRTGLISLALLISSRLVFDAFFLPLLARPVPGNPYAKTVAIPEALQVLGYWWIFLISAWLGCRRRVSKHTVTGSAASAPRTR